MLFEGINVNTNQSSEPKTIGSPVGGLNGRDSLANMGESDAYEMINIIPGTSTCKIRPGCEIHQTGLGGPVESIEGYASATGQNLLAFAVPHIWEVTIKDTKTSLKANLAGSQVVSTMFSTVADGHQFLIITTGADIPMSYNGAVITNLTLVDEAALSLGVGVNFVCNYMGRLFFGVEDKLGFYYLPPGQIQGTCEWFDLGQASVGGGYLQAIATCSVDAGDGPNDYIVFISNRGEYFMYQGIDPGDANNWQLVGRYRGSEPIGRKCVRNYASDLLILTTSGVEQFSEIRKHGNTTTQADTLSSKLGSILLDHNVHKDLWGWCMMLWPSGGLLVVNVPDSEALSGDYHQFAMNTITQAWTLLSSKEWNALCWTMANKELYFGRFDGTVRKIGGQYDNDKPIEFSVKQAYNYFNTPAHKHFKWAKFLVKSEAPVVLASKLSVDFREDPPATEPNPISTGGGAVWDIDFWDIGVWGSGGYTQSWIAAYGNYGVAASHWLQGSIKGASFEWYSTEHVFEKTQGLL
jgi:hypothetical protein